MTRILIIEQDVFFGDVLNQKIQAAGHETFVVNNGAVAIEQIHLFKPDLVLLDMELTTSDGMTILKQKQQDASISSIPVITLSRSGDLSEIKATVDLNVKDYLVKAQLNLDELLTKIKTHLPKGAPKQGGALGGKTVMWVEDDQFLSDLISRKLSTQGCKLLYAKNGEDGLKLLESEKPDIIILDLLLPGISGFDVLQKIKSDAKTKAIPVIILSNYSQNNEIDRAKDLGAERFLVKASIVLDDLVRELTSVLASHA